MNDMDDITILVVDDNKENLSVVGGIIRELGYKIIFSLNGKDAVELTESQPVTIILLDIMMPDMDGFEVCRILKGNPKTKDIPVIFLTAKIDTEDLVTGFSIGGVDYITKPFKKEELVVRLNNHIELLKARRIISYQAEELRKSNKLLMSALHGIGKIVGNK